MYTITVLVQLLLLITFLWVAGTTLMGLLHPQKKTNQEAEPIALWQ